MKIETYEILSTNSLSGSRIIINDNFKMLEEGLNDLYKKFDIDENTDKLLIKNVEGLSTKISRNQKTCLVINEQGHIVVLDENGNLSLDINEFLIGLKNGTYTTNTEGQSSPIVIQGPAGPQGPKGDKGDTGATGPQGPQGEKGDKGDTGATGPQGPQGEKGDKGDTGATGPQGPQGEKGDKGDKGDTGATGPQGPMGPAGPGYIPDQTSNNGESENGESNSGTGQTEQEISDELMEQVENNIETETEGGSVEYEYLND